MFELSNIKVVDNVKDWKDAIKLSAQLLLDSKSIENRYIDKMIENVEKLGFYIVLDEFVAMPHSRPEDGVLKTDISFLKVNNAVDFGDNKIKLIFTLAAKDSNSHIEVIQQLLEILQNEDIKNQLLNANNLENIYKILNLGGVK